MRGGEFVKRVQRLARLRDTPCRFAAGKGKGSHGVLYFGEKKTIVQDRKRELKTGTLHGMLKQLGLSIGDLD
jgi:mRNA interferase HicA